MLPALLFDLDGTLVDSIELILASARFAFEDFTGLAPTDDQWRASIGRPLADAFRDYVPDEREVQRLIVRFREYQVANHDRLMRAYDGVVDVVRGLAAAGHPMALVTSKPDLMAQRGLVHIGLDDAIPVIVGCDSCTRHKPHPEPVERALGLLEVAPGDAVFVGDSPHDVECGRRAGVLTVGVTWGAFSRESMHGAGADVVIEGIGELPGVVRRQGRRTTSSDVSYEGRRHQQWLETT